MPRLPPNAEIVSLPQYRHAVKLHSEDFKNCLGEEYRKCNGTIPFYPMFTRKLRGVTVDEAELASLHEQLEDCKRSAYARCVGNYGW